MGGVSVIYTFGFVGFGSITTMLIKGLTACADAAVDKSTSDDILARKDD